MSALLAPTPIFKAFDNNGLPLALGFLTTYAAGTLTKIPSYVDASQTTQNTNPVQLNFRGECPLWLDPTLTYKFALTDVFGNTIPGWPVDNIPGNGATGGASIIPTADNVFTLGNSSFAWANIYVGVNHAAVLDTVSGNIGYYARTVAEIAATVTPTNYSFAPGDVRRYGADSTGTADSAAAFNAAHSIVGLNVTYPQGTFKLGSNLNAPRCATIQGAGGYLFGGTVLKPQAAVTKLFSITSTGGNYPEYIGRFAIDGTATTNAIGMVLGDSGAVHVDVANLYIGNFTGSTGFGLKIADTLQTWLRHVYVFGCGTNLQVSGDAGFPTTTQLSVCQFDSATVGQGVAILTGFDIIFDNCVFESNAAEGCKIIPAAAGVCRNIVLNRCWFENNHAAYHLVVDGSAAGASAFVRLNEPYFNTGGAAANAVNVTGAGSDVLIRAPVFTSSVASNIIFQGSAFGRIDQWDNFWSYDNNVTDAAAKVMGWEGPLTTYSPTITGVGSGGSISAVTVNQARWRRVAVNMLFIEINFTGTVAGTPNYLNVTIPSGFTLKNAFVKYPALITSNSVELSGSCLADGAQGLRFAPLNAALYAAGAGGGIVQGLFEVVG